MKMLIIKSQKEFDSYGGVFDCDVRFLCNIFTDGDICAEGGISSEGDIYAKGYICSNGNIYARGDISSDIAIYAKGYIYSKGSVLSRGYVKTSSVYGVYFGIRLSCYAVIPGSSFGDRLFWSKRFGIDTSTGCYDEFVERLSVVAKKLLRRKGWLPLEVLMLESSLGMYRKSASK